METMPLLQEYLNYSGNHAGVPGCPTGMRRRVPVPGMSLMSIGARRNNRKTSQIAPQITRQAIDALRNDVLALVGDAEQLLKSGAVEYDYRMVRFEMGGYDPFPQRDLGIPVYSA
jgi:hypothetical protein